MENHRIPSIRFKGFSDAWEQRKLNELGNVETGNTPSTSIKEYYSEEGLIWITPTDITSNITLTTEKKLSEKGEKVARVIPANSILCTCIASIGKNTFSPVKCAFNQQINALIPSKSNDPYFLFVDSYNWSQSMLKGAGGLTFQIVNKTEFSNIVTFVPSIGEQKKIGYLFYKLDNFITLHQRECQVLINTKKALLEKMFPSEHEAMPKIRFKGFSDAWEQRKLDEIAVRLDNLRIPIAESKRIKGETPYYGANGIQDYVSGFTHDGENILVAEDGANDLNNYPVYYVKGRIWVNNHAHVLRTRENFSPNFLKYAFSKIDMESILVGGSRSKLNANILMDLVFKVPSYFEQKKIGTILDYVDSLITLHQRDYVDSLITLHQRKCEKLKNMKKSLLEKMFI